MPILIEKTSLDAAIIAAKKESIEEPKTYIYVIESKGVFYIDDNGFVRTWETLHKIFLNGEEVNDD